jgi:prolyl oligopeptidase
VALNYPDTRQDDVVDQYHGEAIPDPYRWLEDADAPDTATWVAAQNAVTEAYLAARSVREDISSRLAALWDYPRHDLPFERGGRWFQTRNTGLQDQPVLYVAETPGAEGRPLLDPNLLSKDGTVAVSSRSVSEDGSRLAYATSAAGSDWRTWHVRDVAGAVDLDDVLEWSKFTAAAWRHDGSGFYYGGMPRPEPGREFQQENRAPEIRFHRIGTPQSDDAVVFAAPGEPEWIPDVAVSDDDRYLIITIARGTNPETQVQVLDLDAPDNGFQVLVAGFTAKASVVTNIGSTFVVHTDDQTDRGRVVSVDLEKPDPTHWTELLGEQEETLLEVHHLGGMLVSHYLRDAHSLLRVHRLDGSYVRDIPLPGMVSVAGGRIEEPGISGRRDRDLLHFRVTSFVESGALWSHHLGTGVTELVQGSTAAVDPTRFVTEQVFATSADGTRVPIFLTHLADLAATGEVPTLLYGYGGFDIAVTPSFSVPMALWIERGGLLAVANLRGGGEYGKEWYDAGRLARKQNVFDDFAACAKWLHASGWTAPHRTAIQGGSNGGLLVGASLTQRPDLFGAVVGDVGVFDMLRFHHFTIGWAWTSDYGNPDDPDQYPWLRAYSPLHQVRPGTCYPPTMLLTGDHDDRVIPGHTLKFAATLQAAQGCDHPILLRVETAAGHGAGKPVSKAIAESTDRLTFLETAVGGRP